MYSWLKINASEIYAETIKTNVLCHFSSENCAFTRQLQERRQIQRHQTNSCLYEKNYGAIQMTGAWCKKWKIKTD
jgi:hypothetical protein